MTAPSAEPVPSTRYLDVHLATLSLLQASDSTKLWQSLLGDAIGLVNGDGGSVWVSDGDVLKTLMAGGTDSLARTSPRLVDDDIARVRQDAPESFALVGEVRVPGRGSVGFLRVCRNREDGPFDAESRSVFAALMQTATAVMATLLKQDDANARSRDFALVAEMSREVTATLDLDRVLRAVVNLASRAITFDRGALALYEDGECDIRAVAGADAIDPSDPRLKDLATRAAWAAGRGEGLYVSDRDDPGSDAERTFLMFFSGDLASDNTRSGVYVPLRDEEGIVGVLVLESRQPEFATEHQRDVIGILANQATVAIRNARLYSQVPLVDVLGAIGERRRAWRAIPRRTKQLLAVGVLAALATLTLLRWPLRVDGVMPVLQPAQRAMVRSLVDGQIEQVLVHEGETVTQGAPLLRLRALEREARRNATAADIVAAERDAALAASRGDASAERLARLRAETARQSRAVADAELTGTIVRAPVAGMILTVRPEALTGTRATAGALLLTIGRTDSLEAEFTIAQIDIARVSLNQAVRLRVDAIPQRTFEGRVAVISAMPTAALADLAGESMRGVADSAATPSALFPVRAMVANPDGAMRPGMSPSLRVLTDDASIAERLLRRPVRAWRLLWWRMTA